MDHDDRTTIKSLKLPAGWRLQWRSDGHWRQVEARHHRAEMAGLLVHGEAFDWTPWSGREPLEGRGGGRWDGTPTWWSLKKSAPVPGSSWRLRSLRPPS